MAGGYDGAGRLPCRRQRLLGTPGWTRVRHGDGLGTILALIVVVRFSIFTARPALTRHHAPRYVTMTRSGPSGRDSGAFP
jgi:hypothetical protein